MSTQAVPETALREENHARYNYWVCAIEGGLYGGALCFVNSSTLIPPLVQSLGAPVWLVSLIPVLMLIGFRLPPIFVAHRLEILRHYKPMLVGLGILQRVPYGVAALVLLWAGHAPMAAIAAVALAPFVSGMFGGLGLTAWQQLVVNTIPERKRPSVFGIRFGISCGIGIVAGKVVTWVLTVYPPMTGYAILHFCTFLVLMMSYGVFLGTREPRADSAVTNPNSLGFVRQMRGLPALLRGDADFVRLLLMRFFFCGNYILSPFLAIHCKAQLMETDSFLGRLIVVQMLGAIAGNVVAGWLGDRFNSKVPVVLGILLFGGMAGWAMFAQTAWAWQGIFFLFGFSFFATEVGNNTLGLEMGPLEKRATYLAIGALIYIPGMLCASAIGTLLWQHNEQFNLLSLATILWLALALLILIPLKERRHSPPMPESKESPF